MSILRLLARRRNHISVWGSCIAEDCALLHAPLPQLPLRLSAFGSSSAWEPPLLWLPAGPRMRSPWSFGLGRFHCMMRLSKAMR